MTNEAQAILHNTNRRYRNDSDPFSKFPHEVLVETIGYLTCLETFRWRTASSAVNQVIIPQREYRRFIREEMEYLPKLLQQTEAYQYTDDGRHIDWKRVFESVSAARRHDDSLRNRRRIWKIVQPIAEEVVERSKEHLMHLQGDREGPVDPVITVVRGKVGAPSGAEGMMHSILFYIRHPEVAVTQVQPGNIHQVQQRAPKVRHMRPSDNVPYVDRILIWLDPVTGFLRGFEFIFRFHFPPAVKDPVYCHRRLGSKTVLQETFVADWGGSALTGVIVSWSQGCISGIAFAFEDYLSEADEFNSNETRTPLYGVWTDGALRRLISPRKYRTFAGMTTFINSAGSFETLAIFEESGLAEDFDGRQLYPPKFVPLSHQEASLWKQEPPTDISFQDREGPVVGYWRLTPSQWVLTSSSPSHQLPGQLKSIVAYIKGQYLAGLRFWYQARNTQNRRHVCQDLGNCSGTDLSKFDFMADENIRAVVIGHSPRGIHSLQVSLNQSSERQSLIYPSSFLDQEELALCLVPAILALTLFIPLKIQFPWAENG
jgi:hypothetical protein